MSALNISQHFSHRDMAMAGQALRDDFHDASDSVVGLHILFLAMPILT